MRASWAALHAQLSRSTATLRFQTDFAELCRGRTGLARLKDPAALFDALHCPRGDAEVRNRILRALVEAAQGPQPEPAATLLLLALWPGLDAARRRLSRCFLREPDALASELLSRVLENIQRLDLGRVAWIAATLIRNAERDIKRSLQAAPVFDPLPERETAREEPASLLGLPLGLDADAAVGLIASRLRATIGDDAALVAAVAVRDLRQGEAALALGCTPAAARKRYQRALARLRKEFGAAA
ncbi:MAG: sigma-70 family RNA polymerase sigma factor [Rhodobacteraceae bacterium]|nr:sigma-70 family RNA polymerase sigma factor [Paracoccaceae bacterium]